MRISIDVSIMGVGYIVPSKPIVLYPHPRPRIRYRVRESFLSTLEIIGRVRNDQLLVGFK